jgi:hypothetical protein
MYMLSMKNRYGKPGKFSEPYEYEELKSSPEAFREILDKKDGELTDRDFGIIFSSSLPAADYQEGLYYIPLCFDYMLRKQDPIRSNICSSLFWYIYHFRDKLKADGYYEECLRLTRKLVELYTSEFELIRLDDNQIEEYCIDKNYREMAKYSEAVCDLVDCLIKYPNYWTILCDWIDSLNSVELTKSGWWIEISHHTRWWHRLYREDDEANERKEILINRLHKFGVYVNHWLIVENWAGSQKFYEYNRRKSIV